jgi:hypothetical protein
LCAEKIARSVYDKVEESEEKRRAVIEGFPKPRLIAGFENGKREWTKVSKTEGTPSSKLSVSVFSARISLLESESPETE